MTTATLGSVVAYVRRLTDRDAQTSTDRQLLERFQRDRDESAFAELVRRHGPMVQATCKRVLRHEQDAEDAFQAAFLVLARKAASIRQGESLGGWLYQVAHRLAVRARSIGVQRQARFTPLACEIAERAAPTLRAALDEELERLPEDYRSAIVLCYLEGRTQTEAARLLATTADAINSRLKRARDLLRHRLSRCGFALSAVAVAETLAANTANAALAPTLIRHTAHTALQFVVGPAATSGASALATALAQGALQSASRLKFLSAFLLAVTLMTTGALMMPAPAAGKHPGPDLIVAAEARPLPPEQPGGKKKTPLSCILLWMAGGPSQNDTFDPKPGNVALFKAIDTNVKDVQFTENLPKLAKQANHLAIIRSLTHRVPNHINGTHYMRTGYEQNPAFAFPGLGCVIAKELGDARPDLPRYFLLNSLNVNAPGMEPSFLGKPYAALGVAGVADNRFPLPPVDAFEALAKGKGEAQRKAVEKAFDLSDEKAELRAAYGPSRFGQGCLLARRLIECGVPVVEVALPGWDAHNNTAGIVPQRCADLDAGFATLLKDLHERKKLDSTLIVWMGEFGRTPAVNINGGRDHFSTGFTVVLAGAGIKGGQVIGKTSADGATIDARPVTPQELLATVYQAVGVDAAKTNRTPAGMMAPLVEKGHEPVKETLR